MSSELENRTKAALKQFDNNMAGIFDRKSFYEGQQQGDSKQAAAERATAEASRAALVPSRPTTRTAAVHALA
jgi:hypothetical protein